jgi:hypothetical protein
VISFLGVGSKKAADPMAEYCRACRKLKKDHCETCSRKIIEQKRK